MPTTRSVWAVLAYNADYDCGVIVSDCHRHRIRRTRLADLGH